MDDLTYRGTAFAGFFIIALIAWATGDRNAINRKTIGGSLCLAWGIGVLTFWLPWTRSALEWVNDGQGTVKGGIASPRGPLGAATCQRY